MSKKCECGKEINQTCWFCGTPYPVAAQEPSRPVAVSSTDGLEEQAAAHRFTETMVSRADGQGGPWPSEFPLWHGWALQEAFVKGIEWERSRSSNEKLRDRRQQTGGN